MATAWSISHCCASDRAGQGPLLDPGTAPINGAFDLYGHAIPQIEQLVWTRRQGLAAEGARFVHAFLAQLFNA